MFYEPVYLERGVMGSQLIRVPCKIEERISRRKIRASIDDGHKDWFLFIDRRPPTAKHHAEFL